MTQLLTTDAITGNVWNVQLAVLEGQKTLFKNVNPAHLTDENWLSVFTATAQQCLNDLKYSAIRTAAIEVLDVISRLPSK